MKLVIATLIALTPVSAFAGQVGSSSTNSYSTERYSGTREVQGHSQSQEQLYVSGYSASAKAEFYVPAGVSFTGSAQLGATVGGSNPVAYCNASTRVDPSCYASTTQQSYFGFKSSNSQTSFKESGHVTGETFSHTAGSSSSF
jgi:hypothetical protein